jgi:predicted MFS family arabinose efflux permease
MCSIFLISNIYNRRKLLLGEVFVVVVGCCYFLASSPIFALRVLAQELIGSEGLAEVPGSGVREN